MGTAMSATAVTHHPSVDNVLDISPLLSADIMSKKQADGKTTDGVEYCPYSVNSKTYDTRRLNPNPDVYLGNAALSGIPLSEQRLLDVGCGTGSFLEQMEPFFGEICGVEYNEGMLEQAVARFADKINLVQGAAQKIPHADASFDVVTVNQVIHHFSTEDNFQELLTAMGEICRVLKPGGKLVLCTSTPEQQRDAFWWLSLFPEASAKICQRFPPLEIIKQHAESVGLKTSRDGILVSLERPLMNPDLYLDGGVELAFDPEYRKCDSSWEMIEPKELETGLAAIRAMQEAGTAEEWLSEREKLRMGMGQATFVVASKPK